MTEQTLTFTLETATLADLGDLGEMERICFPLDAWPLLERIGALALPSVVRIKAVSAGRMIGFVGGDIRRRAGIGWITTISVLPDYRRAGVAEALLAACEQEMGMPRVRLAVRRSNEAAQALYLKHGYQTVETWRHYYQGGEDGIVMEKVIDSSPA